MKQEEKIREYIHNLSEAGAKQALLQILTFPETRSFIMNCVEEFNKAFNFPEVDKK